jgi:hypothetical protein
LAKPAFWNNTKRYYDLKSYWRNTFSCNVYKLPIDAGFTCPNRDGQVGWGGCIYCDGRGSKLRREGSLPTVSQQIETGKAFYRQARGAAKYIAYFQTFTNTYGPIEQLQALYDEALAQKDVLGLSIGTRPDCVSDAVLDLLGEYAREHHVWLELGLQSAHDETLRWLNRGHNFESYLNAVSRAAARKLHICTHLIVGLQGENKAVVMETARIISSLPVQGIKIHCLLALRGTALGTMYERGEITLIGKDEYVETVCDVLEILPPEMVVQRLTADGYREIFLAPDWAVNKLGVLNAINDELERRNTHQGISFASRGLL